MSFDLIDQTISEFRQFSPIEKYKFLDSHRSLLRDLQKLSYRISQFDKKFPFETLKPEQYEEVLRVYLEFLLEARDTGLILGEDFLKK